jgi:hypothetical protein
MDGQIILNICAALISLLLVVLGWFIRYFANRIGDAMADLTTKINEIQVILPSTYVTKNDFKPALEKVDFQFEKMAIKFDKIEGLVNSVLLEEKRNHTRPQ